MHLRKGKLLDVLLGAGLYLLDPVRDRLADRIETISEKAQDVYDTASQRVRRASRDIQGTGHSTLTSASALLLGVGAGVCLGFLFAPASGETTRSTIAGKVHEFSGKVRDRVSGEPSSSTGTYE